MKDNFDLNRFIRDFKTGKNPYGGTPQPLTEAKDDSIDIASFLNSNFDEVKQKFGNVYSKFETIGDPKVATAGKGEEGIDVSFDENHMLELFPEGDPYNKVESTSIGGKTIYYNDYRGITESKETYVNEFLSEVEAKLNEFRDEDFDEDFNPDDISPEDLYGDVTVSHGERKPYDPLLEKEEKEEEVEVEDEEVTDEEGEDIDIEMDMEEEGGVDELENHLESALKIARSMGDEKLADQIGNTVTFFTRQYVAREQD